MCVVLCVEPSILLKVTKKTYLSRIFCGVFIEACQYRKRKEQDNIVLMKK